MSDHHFPRFHVRPPRGFLNDPNGPLLLDGGYHLFFQYRHTTDLDEPVLWGHATSTDLASWSLQRPAMAPHPYGVDRDGCWSGNTVLDDAGLVRAFYSGRRNDHPYESVVSAISRDGGASFGKPVQVVADPHPEEGIVSFRDPYVWRDGAGWLMAVGAGDRSEVASVRLYGSPDLDRWTHVGTLAEQPRTVSGTGPNPVDTGAMWECPQVVHLDGRAVILLGAWSRDEGTMGVYAVTGIDPAGGGAPVLTSIDGPDFYAGSILRDSPDGPVLWGWAREAREHAWSVEAGWSGGITLPRLVGLDAAGRLTQRPVPSLTRLRVEEIPTTGELPAQLEFEVTVAAWSAGRLTLRFGDREQLVVEIDTIADEVRVDRSEASTDPRAAGGVHRIADAFGEGPATVRGFLDGSLLELFTSAGRAATIRCYPTTPPPWSIETAGAVQTLRLWRLAADRTESAPVADSRVGAA